ncbi:ABC transporter permease [Pseudoglutamicibacter albus]|uniref:ABC transporter permease n=1 Tax=Pseudoglutamicibacter albus TaxID=98671 RepID=UPI0036084E86
MAVLSTVAVFLGWQPKPTFGWAVLIGVLGVITFTALGLLIAGTVRAQATLAITNIGLVLIAAIGGVLMPLTRLHDALAGFVQLLPSAALGEGMRDALAHGHINIQATIVLAGWALILVAAAIRNFRWEN